MEGVNRHDSTDFVEQEETSSIDNVEWTNEKHIMYLKSMEASFVNQLYSLKDLFSWSANVKLCRQGSPFGSRSDQFEAREHCHRPKKNRRTAPQPEVVYGSPDVASDNDAIKHQPLDIDGGNPQVLFNLNEECTDQNFINEGSTIRAPSGQRAKRLRTLDASDACKNDQVVPSGMLRFPMQDQMKVARMCRTER